MSLFENTITGFPVALVAGSTITLDGHYVVTVERTHMCNSEAEMWAYISKRRIEEQLPPLEVRELNLEPYRESCGREAESDERVRGPGNGFAACVHGHSLNSHDICPRCEHVGT